MQSLAAERGGRCLSTEYLGTTVKLTWQCHQGHVWEAAPTGVKNQGRWCPNCAFLQMTKDPKKRRKWDFEGKGVSRNARNGGAGRVAGRSWRCCSCRFYATRPALYPFILGNQLRT